MTGVATLQRHPLVRPLAIGAGVLVAAFATDTAVCPTRVCTGHVCPGCGMTRAVVHGLRGDFAESWRFHPLAGLLAIQLLGWLMLRRWAPDQLTPTLTQWALGLNAVLLVAVWAIRWRLGLLDQLL